MTVYNTIFDKYQTIEISEGISTDVRKLVYPDGSVRVEVIAVKNGSRVHPITVSLRNVSSEVSKLLDVGANLDNAQLHNVAASIKKDFDNLPIKQADVKLGFNSDETFRSSVTVSGDGSFYKNDPTDELTSWSGGADITLLKNMLSNKRRALLILNALAAPLVALTKSLNPIILLYGDSSVGKTTISKYVQSLSVAPDFEKVNLDLNNTLNKLEDALVDNFGVSVIFDDASLNETINFKDLFYRLANGKRKGRLSKTNHSRGEFHTTVLMSAEEDVAKIIPADYKGIDARVFKMYVDKQDLFESADEVAQVEALMENQYGNVLPHMIKYMMEKGMDTITSMIKEQETKYRLSLKDEENVVVRWGHYFAMISTTASIMQEVFGLNINIEEIVQFMLDTLRENVVITNHATTVKLVEEELFPMLMEHTLDKQIKGETRNVRYIRSSLYKVLINQFISKNKLKSNYRIMTDILLREGLLLKDLNTGEPSKNLGSGCGRCYILSMDKMIEMDSTVEFVEDAVVEYSTAA